MVLLDEFRGSQFFRDATPDEVNILEAAGFTSGGSRYFELANTVTRDRPENGCLVMLLGAAGLAYSLLHRWVSKSR